MSNVSIYEKNWTDLVFEDRNKEYGAYQLRQENPRTTLLAFFIGVLLILVITGSWMLLSSFGAKADAEPTNLIPPISITPVDLSQIPQKRKEPLALKKQPETPPATTPITNNRNFVVATTTVAVTDIPANVDVVNPTTTGAALTTGAVAPVADNGSPTGTDTTAPAVDKPMTTVELDRLPEYPGKIGQFYKDVANKFDREQIDESLSSINVLMSFVIEKDGTMSNIKVLRSSDKKLEREAIRVLQSLKSKWSPGYYNNEKVRTLFTLPIRVALP